MASLFHEPPRTESSFTVKSDPEQRGRDTVLVSKTIASSLSTSDANRLFLSISRQTPEPVDQALRAISCWGVLDENTTELSIPPHWLNDYGHIFGDPHALSLSRNRLTVAAIEGVCLTEVVLTALSVEAFEIIRSAGSSFEDWLSTEPILRQGTIYELHSTSRSKAGLSGHKFRVDMTEPVLQGYVRKGETRFVVAKAEALPESEPGPVLQDIIEIDETFLAGSLTYAASRPLLDHPQPPGPGGRSANPDAVVALRPRALSHPVDDLDDCTLYVQTMDLTQIGLLDGDWGIASVGDMATSRLVRIVANDHLVQHSGTALGSSVLLYNIYHDLSFHMGPIHLSASPFGSHPSLPTASNMTISPIASPLSIDRANQGYLLQALKVYFKNEKRIIKHGDIIMVGIDSGASYKIDESDGDHEEATTFQYKHPVGSVRVNQAVFFRVTVVEQHPVPNGNVGSALADFGCWVDSETTRMVQVGIEHSRVPYPVPGMETAHEAPSRLPGLLGSFKKLLALTSATLLQQVVGCDINLPILLKGPRGVGKFTIIERVAQQLGLHLFEVNCYDIVEKDVERSLRDRFEKAKLCRPCILVLRHIDAMAQTTQVAENGKEPAITKLLNEYIVDIANNGGTGEQPILVFGTSSEPDRLSTGMVTCFKHEVTLDAPNETERHIILTSLLAGMAVAPDVSVSGLATRTAAMVASDLVDLVDQAKYNSVERVMRSTNSQGLLPLGSSVTSADFDLALAHTRAVYSANIGAPRIPSVSWEDVGGLDTVKSDILDTIQLPLDYPELFSKGLKKRSGILLYGPPGTGKTLLAKAVATSCSLNFFSVKGPELLNMYIGESEANVRRVFQRARDAKPCVIFFDELDSVAPKRGNHGDSGGVMDRIVSQLLAELDGISASEGSDVFVIGATNRPDLLDPALLRPGRFDRTLFLGVSDNHPAQVKILEALTRKFHTEPGLNLSALADRCPLQLTGADFYALCADAMLKAMSRKAMEVERKIVEWNSRPREHPITPQYYLAEMASPEDLMVIVSQADFDEALEGLVPSVTESELVKYASLQKQFSSRSQ